MYLLYYEQKIGIPQARKRFEKEYERMLNERFKAEGKLSMTAFKIRHSMPLLKKEQKKIGIVQQQQEKQTRVLEKAILNRDFGKFLKKKGLHDVRRAKK